MKVKDIINENPCLSNVGELLDYLAQFPRDMPLHSRAEPDACSEEGYDWLWVSVQPVWNQELVNAEQEDEMEVKAVELRVDH